jgi:SAM-dependent methyltransferase
MKTLVSRTVNYLKKPSLAKRVSQRVRQILREYWELLELSLVKPANSYCIKTGYRHRKRPIPYDVPERNEAFQDDIYRFACRIAAENQYGRILDIGCGSGYKLLKYFRHADFVGLEIGEALSSLQENQPPYDWRPSDFASPPDEVFDLVICADVIEHLSDPDVLLGFIKKITWEHLIISTPDRDEVVRQWGARSNGPPKNPYHVREWSFAEFEYYIGQHFRVLEHRPAEHMAQVVLAVRKEEGEVGI